jgi:hypothetical protein
MKKIIFHCNVLHPSETRFLMTEYATVDGPFLKIVIGRKTHRIPLSNVAEIITEDESPHSSAENRAEAGWKLEVAKSARRRAKRREIEKGS